MYVYMYSYPWDVNLDNDKRQLIWMLYNNVFSILRVAYWD